MSLNATSAYMPNLPAWNAGVALSEEEQLATYLNRRALREAEMTPGSENPKFFLQQHDRAVQIAALAAEDANGGFDFYL